MNKPAIAGFEAVKDFMAKPLAPLLIALKCWGDEASGTEAEGSINLRGDRLQ